MATGGDMHIACVCTMLYGKLYYVMTRASKDFFFFYLQGSSNLGLCKYQGTQVFLLHFIVDVGTSETKLGSPVQAPKKCFTLL